MWEIILAEILDMNCSWIKNKFTNSNTIIWNSHKFFSIWIMDAIHLKICIRELHKFRAIHRLYKFQSQFEFIWNSWTALYGHLLFHIAPGIWKSVAPWLYIWRGNVDVQKRNLSPCIVYINWSGKFHKAFVQRNELCDTQNLLSDKSVSFTANSWSLCHVRS